jgi:hypothetical protein
MKNEENRNEREREREKKGIRRELRRKKEQGVKWVQ